MKITINGEIYNFSEIMTIEKLLQQFTIDGKKIAVEHNMTIVPQDKYQQTILQDNDNIEIVQFINGG